MALVAGQETEGAGANLVPATEIAFSFKVKALITDTITALHIKFSESGSATTVRLAIQENEAGKPKEGVMVEGSFASSTAGEHEVAVAGTAVTAGTEYWLTAMATGGTYKLKQGSTTAARKTTVKHAKISEVKTADWAAEKNEGLPAIWATSAGGTEVFSGTLVNTVGLTDSIKGNPVVSGSVQNTVGLVNKVEDRQLNVAWAPKPAVGGFTYGWGAITMEELEKAKAAGAKYVRFGAGWYEVEGGAGHNEPGVFELSPLTKERIEYCAANGMQPVLIAGFNAPYANVSALKLAKEAKVGETTVEVTTEPVWQEYKDYLDSKTATGIVTKTKEGIPGALIAGISGKKITLASALTRTIKTSEELNFNRRLYKPIISGNWNQEGVEKFMAYARWTAEQIPALGATGWVCLGNEYEIGCENFANGISFWDTPPGGWELNKSLESVLQRALLHESHLPAGVNYINSASDTNAAAGSILSQWLPELYSETKNYNKGTIVWETAGGQVYEWTGVLKALGEKPSTHLGVGKWIEVARQDPTAAQSAGWGDGAHEYGELPEAAAVTGLPITELNEWLEQLLNWPANHGGSFGKQLYRLKMREAEEGYSVRMMGTEAGMVKELGWQNNHYYEVGQVAKKEEVYYVALTANEATPPPAAGIWGIASAGQIEAEEKRVEEARAKVNLRRVLSELGQGITPMIYNLAISTKEEGGKLVGKESYTALSRLAELVGTCASGGSSAACPKVTFPGAETWCSIGFYGSKRACIIVWNRTYVIDENEELWKHAAPTAVKIPYTLGTYSTIVGGSATNLRTGASVSTAGGEIPVSDDPIMLLVESGSGGASVSSMGFGIGYFGGGFFGGGPGEATSGSFVQGVAGTLKFTGKLPRNTLHGLAGTLKFSGTITKGAVEAFTATLKFAGALPRNTTKQLAAVMKFEGKLRRTREAFSATLKFAGKVVGNLVGAFASPKGPTAATIRERHTNTTFRTRSTDSNIKP